MAVEPPEDLRVSAVCVRSQSAGERSMGPLRPTAIMGLSRVRVIVVQGRDQLTGHVGSNFLPTIDQLSV